MFSRGFRTAALLAFAASLSCGVMTTNANAPRPAFRPPEAASALPPPPVVVYSQPPSPSGGLIKSSLRDPDGSPTDERAWDNFQFAWTQSITEVDWRGGYQFGSGGTVFNFTVDIFPSIPAGTEPDVAHPPLVHYNVGNNAGETPADMLGGVQTYDYRFVLPVPFQAAPGMKYWVQIEAFQPGAPDWGLVKGTGGDAQHYRYGPVGGGYMYQMLAGDAAFSLLGPGNRLYMPMVLRF